MRQYLWNLAIWITQTLNVATGGDPDEYFSSRVGKCARGDFGPGWQLLGFVLADVIDVLFKPFDGPNHCIRSIEDDEGRRDVLFGRKQFR